MHKVTAGTAGHSFLSCIQKEGAFSVWLYIYTRYIGIPSCSLFYKSSDYCFKIFLINLDTSAFVLLYYYTYYSKYWIWFWSWIVFWKIDLAYRQIFFENLNQNLLKTAHLSNFQLPTCSNRCRWKKVAGVNCDSWAPVRVTWRILFSLQCNTKWNI